MFLRSFRIATVKLHKNIRNCCLELQKTHKMQRKSGKMWLRAIVLGITGTDTENTKKLGTFVFYSIKMITFAEKSYHNK
jgi:hypothetical protein